MSLDARLKAWRTRRERYGLSGRAIGERSGAQKGTDLFSDTKPRHSRVAKPISRYDVLKVLGLLTNEPPQTEEAIAELNKLIGTE